MRGSGRSRERERDSERRGTVEEVGVRKEKETLWRSSGRSREREGRNSIVLVLCECCPLPVLNLCVPSKFVSRRFSPCTPHIKLDGSE